MTMFTLKTCSTAIIYILCFGLFLAIIVELVLDVLKGPTGTTIQIVEHESLQLPAFTVCAEKAYKVPSDHVLHSICLSTIDFAFREREAIVN